LYGGFPGGIQKKGMNPRIIDTHIHNWDFNRAEYSWLEGDETLLNRNYLLDELNPQIENSGITQGVMVQAANNPEDTLLMLEAAENNNWIAGVVAWVPLTDPEETQKSIRENAGFRKYVKGVRHLIHNEPDPAWLLQREVLESLRIIAHHQLTYDIVGVTEEHLLTAMELASRIPELNLVLDHLNHPPIASKEKFGRWGSLMKSAAAHQNLHCKISGLGTCTSNPDGWTKEDIKPYILFVLNEFGTERCFCGGDWPVSLLAGSYEKTWRAYRDILLEVLSPEEGHKVLFENARRFYHLDID
jgi:L-fuconolactonase